MTLALHASPEHPGRAPWSDIRPHFDALATPIRRRGAVARRLVQARGHADRGRQPGDDPLHGGYPGQGGGSRPPPLLHGDPAGGRSAASRSEAPGGIGLLVRPPGDDASRLPHFHRRHVLVAWFRVRIAVLELLGLPYTGSSSYTTSLCLRKHVVNGCSSAPGCPSQLRRRPARREIPSVGFPAICKPAAEDASLGIEQRSVVRTTRQLAERVSAMLESWDEILVQRYVDGREMNVGILGDTVLPIAGDRLQRACPRGCGGSSPTPPSGRPVATRTSARTAAAPRACPPKSPPRRAVSRRGLELVGGTGYGRVDMRIDERRPAVDPRGERQPRHRSRRRPRAHGRVAGTRVLRTDSRGLRARPAAQPREIGHGSQLGAGTATLRRYVEGEYPLELFRGRGMTTMRLDPLRSIVRPRVAELHRGHGRFRCRRMSFATTKIDVVLSRLADGDGRGRSTNSSARSPTRDGSSVTRVRRHAGTDRDL